MTDADDLADRVQAGDLRLYELESHADADTAAAARRELLARETGADLGATGSFTFDAESVDSAIENLAGGTQLPLGVAGPLAVSGARPTTSSTSHSPPRRARSSPPSTAAARPSRPPVAPMPASRRSG